MISLVEEWLSSVSYGVDRIDWASCRTAFNANVSQLLNRCSLLFGTLIKQNPFSDTIIPSITSATTPLSVSAATNSTPSSLATPSSATAAINILPLAVNSGRIAPLSVQLYPTRHPQPQNTISPRLTTTSITTKTTPTAAQATVNTQSSASALPSSLSIGNLQSVATALQGDITQRGRQLLGRFSNLV